MAKENFPIRKEMIKEGTLELQEVRIWVSKEAFCLCFEFLNNV
jgi:hypothetical protein